MFGLFFAWIRKTVKEAVFAGLADAAAEMDAEAEKNATIVEEFRTRVLAITDKKKKSA
jgi:hypothetical protein